ncbi:MAG: type IV toxin-antitoxin system AbiEi family antitoxin domain-containing protein [Arthrobacter sp.]|uniref:type IV toxin-antitoxin system AbiEi family antitoxin domain-containing protein n=1 Tax=Arthrobacter sp. TaxID=1667 RepID=UPI003485903E
MDAEEALADAGGLARWKALAASGVQARQLRAAVAAGTVVRPGHGLYAVPGIAPELVTALSRGSSLGCVSAARFHGLWVHHRQGLHLSSPRGVRAPSNGRVHRLRQSHGPVVPLDVCLRQVLGCLPDREALVVAESAVVKGLVTLDDLEGLSAGRGSLRAAAVIARIDARAESVPETLARDVLRAAGYAVACQRRIRGVGRVDLEVDGALLIEIDGRTYHSDERSFAEDRRRWNELTIQGRDVLVLPAKPILMRPESVLEPVGRYFLGRASSAGATSVAVSPWVSGGAADAW